MTFNNKTDSKNKSQGKRDTPLCTLSCPLNVDARGYIRLIGLSEFEKALEKIIENNPLPSVCGRICNHPCEIECRRGGVDEPVSIRALKSFVSTHIQSKKPELAKPTGKKVAVVGSGPSGLTCAYYLALKGHKVTVCEERTHPGGMLYWGIPEFRLPKKELERDIEYIKKTGIKIKIKTRIEGKKQLNKLLKEGFDAIYLAIGCQQTPPLGISGEELEGVHKAIEFLRKFNSGEKIKFKNQVIVVGGGDVAIDTARSAIRCGAQKVKVLYRRSENEMPASSKEFEAAKIEGITFEFLSAPSKFIGVDGKVSSVECIKMRLGKLDESGRRSPKHVSGSNYTIEASDVIIAVSQKPDSTSFAGLDLDGGLFKVNSKTLETSMGGVFAGGDVVSGSSYVVEAMALGRKAAESIDCYLTGREFEPAERSSSLTGFSPKTLDRIKRVNRISGLDPDSLSSDIVSEALRCLNCGAGAIVEREKCAACLACVRICPYQVPKLVDDVAEIDLNECQSCGFCFSECPALAITVCGEVYLNFDEKVVESIPENNIGVVLVSCSNARYLLEDELSKNLIPSVVVDCVGRLPKERFLHLLSQGFKGVIVASCDEGDCIHKTGNSVTCNRIGELDETLNEISMGGRIRFFEASNLLELGLNKVLGEIIEGK